MAEIVKCEVADRSKELVSRYGSESVTNVLAESFAWISVEAKLANEKLPHIRQILLDKVSGS